MSHVLCFETSIGANTLAPSLSHHPIRKKYYTPGSLAPTSQRANPPPFCQDKKEKRERR
ncbi:MAG: hypothetical protein ACI8RD_007849 [Bacillariaceae sp.]|jgi:hypothetical protein